MGACLAVTHAELSVLQLLLWINRVSSVDVLPFMLVTLLECLETRVPLSLTRHQADMLASYANTPEPCNKCFVT